MLLQFVQILYWLALSTWFGGVLFIAISSPIIFRTIRDSKAVLPHVLSVNLENQHGTLLAGTIVGNILSNLTRIALGCAAMLLISLGMQWILLNLHDRNTLIFLILRSAFYIAAVVLMLYDWRVVWPKIWKYRQEYIDHADEPDVANPAKEQFDRYHRETVTLLSIVLFVLLGMVLFGGLFATQTVIRFGE